MLSSIVVWVDLAALPTSSSARASWRGWQGSAFASGSPERSLKEVIPRNEAV